MALNTKYEVFSIFSSDRFTSLLCGIDLADCMKSEVSYPITDSFHIEEDFPSLLQLMTPLDLTVSDTLFCSYCQTKFQDQSEQRNHYKLDWHRHNLKQHLKGVKFLSEEEFTKLEDDVSSISGSESDSSDADEVPNGEQSGGNFQANLMHQKQFVRHPKVFFVNQEKNILSLYRCLLHGKEDVPSSSKQLCDLAMQCPSRSTWAILMLGGGHFAAAIFHGNVAVMHKTFHSYTVRSKQGGSQSSRDSRSGTSHPKSAGASLRRYNEASFQQHISDVLEKWSDDLSKCNLIFLRAVSHNRNLIFTGKNSVLKKTDPRLRNIPFPTRRATFSEVKRVHGLLSSLEVYGSAEDFESKFPVTPRKPEPVEQSSAASVENETNSPRDSPASSPSKPAQKSRKKIDRGKARLSPCRPLPDHIESLAADSSGSSGGSDIEMLEFVEVMDLSVRLKEFDDDVPQEQKEKHNAKRNRKKKTEKQEPPQDTTESQAAAAAAAATASPEGSEWVSRVLLARHDTSVLATVLAEREAAGVSEEEACQLLSRPVDTRGNTLLHAAATLGQADRVRFLLEAGADPAVCNKDKNPPFKVAKDWDTKKIFRRFQAEFPDRYNYEKAAVPGALTDDIERLEEAQYAEKKKAKRLAQKKRLTEKKKENQERRKIEEQERKEKEERDRYLELSDREKRALAAERRALATGGHVSGTRCFTCASDMTGQVPFTYGSFLFCSMPCLKAHRAQTKTTSLM